MHPHAMKSGTWQRRSRMKTLREIPHQALIRRRAFTSAISGMHDCDSTSTSTSTVLVPVLLSLPGRDSGTSTSIDSTSQ
jgi:hypothetical protein